MQCINNEHYLARAFEVNFRNYLYINYHQINFVSIKYYTVDVSYSSQGLTDD